MKSLRKIQVSTFRKKIVCQLEGQNSQVRQLQIYISQVLTFQYENSFFCPSF